MFKKYFTVGLCGLSFVLLLNDLSWARARHVETVKRGSGQWELLVDGAPYFVKGVVYNFWPVGDDPNKGTLRDWSVLDSNHNGRTDIAYDSWVDKNKNNQQDPDEPVVGDWKLLEEMGANTIRVYQMPSNDPRIDHLYVAEGSRLTFSHPPNKELFRDLYHNHGIMVAVGHFFGEWAIGSGASWENGTDYTDPVQRQNLLNGVRVMVDEHKDEPYTLLWIIGNENFRPFDQDNAESEVKAFLTLVNEAARLIHELDPHHPVAICNLTDRNISVFQRHCPHVDIYGTNMYSRTFDPVWKKARHFFDRPVLITEYGLPAYSNGKERQHPQSEYHKTAWQDIERNRYGGTGVGNSIGGMIFNWSDQWAINGNADQHDFVETASVPGEEWFGLVTLGDGSYSPFLRQPRMVYYTYQELWARDKCADKGAAP